MFKNQSFTYEIPQKYVKLREPGRKGSQKAANVLWFFFGGLFAFIEQICLGISQCASLIFIPFGIQRFKVARLVLKPFGNNVATNFKHRPFLNILYGIFGGWESFIVLEFLSWLISFTVVGKPIGDQLKKLAKFELAPFGAQIVTDGEYTSYKENYIDYITLMKKINADPNKEIKAPNGETSTAIGYMKDLFENQNIEAMPRKQTYFSRLIASIITISAFVLAFGITYGACFFVEYSAGGDVITLNDFINTIKEGISELPKESWLQFGYGFFAMLCAFIISRLIKAGKKSSARNKLVKEYKENLQFLFEYYPEEAKFADPIYGFKGEKGYYSLPQLGSIWDPRSRSSALRHAPDELKILLGEMKRPEQPVAETETKTVEQVEEKVEEKSE